MSKIEVIQNVALCILVAGIITWLLVNQNRRDAGQLKKYRRIFELSPELIVLLNPTNGRIMEINGRVQELVGYSPKDLVGRSIMEWPHLPEASKKIALENLRRRMQGEQVSPYELEFCAQDGRRLVGRVFAVPLTDSAGKVIADLVMISDITGRKVVEERLQKMVSDLERHNRLMVGREMRVVELKKEVNVLLRRLGQPIAYPAAETEHTAASVHEDNQLDDKEKTV